MAPSRKIIHITSDEVDRCWVGKKKQSSNQSNDSDDDCVILDGDPDKSLRVVNESGNESDELLVVAEKGQVACRDYPHARHLCARFPFNTNPHEKYCDLCHCYVCDIRAPCVSWGTGKSSGDHCHSTDKEEIWRVLRQNSKQGNMAQLPASEHPATTLSNVSPLHTAPSRSQPINSDGESEVLSRLRLALDRLTVQEDRLTGIVALDWLTVQADRLTGIVKWFDNFRGYGFITPDDGGEDVFVHQSSIKSKGHRSLDEGEAVGFKIETGDDGRKKAIDVSPLAGETASDTSECYKCGEVGHIARNCSSSECYKCGEKGHFARDCSYTEWNSDGSDYDGSETSESNNCGETGQLGLRDMSLVQPTAQADRLTGIVKWFDSQKGYGFITLDNGGEDLFVHKSSIKSKGYRSLVEGEAVEFKIETGDCGRKKAIDVSSPGGSFVQGTTSDTSACCYICGGTGHFARNCSYTGSRSGEELFGWD